MSKNNCTIRVCDTVGMLPFLQIASTCGATSAAISRNGSFAFLLTNFKIGLSHKSAFMTSNWWEVDFLAKVLVLQKLGV